MTSDEIRARIERLLRTAETGADFAEIAYLEAILNDGPWFDPDED